MDEPIKLQHASCPRCGSKESTIVLEGQDFDYRVPGRFFVSRCSACALWFQNPRPAAEDIPKLYPPNYAPHAPAHAGASGEPAGDPSERRECAQRGLAHSLKDWVRNLYLWNIHVSLGYPWQAECDVGLGTSCWAFLLRPLSGKLACFRLIPHYVRDGRLLEIGSGAGDFLAELRGKGWNAAEGIELNPDAADTARRRGFPVACGPVEKLLRGFPDNHFDVIVSAMVLEHLLNPFEVVRAIAAKLKPGGEFLFSTVVRDAIDARLYGAFWRNLDLPRHMIFFTQDDLHAVLRDQFECVEHVHHNMPNDFVLSAGWRGKRLDWIVGRLFASALGWPAGFALAALHLTSRVSFRCRKKARA